MIEARSATDGQQAAQIPPDSHSAFTDPATGFIRHPLDYPLEMRRIWSWRRPTPRGRGLGLCFESDHPYRPGTRLEIGIPLRGETQWFEGEVVMLREEGDGYDLGWWLASEPLAHRLRIVEQICHIECELRHRRGLGMVPLSRERIARDWISRFAAHFPMPARSMFSH